MRHRHRAALAAAACGASLLAGVALPAVASANPVPPSSARHPRVWVKDCPLHRFSTEPRSFVVACADTAIYFRHLTWSGWGQATTVGTGILWENDCSPNCASGRSVSERGTLTLSQVERQGGRGVYRYASVQPSPPNRHHFQSFGYDLIYG